MPAVVVNTTQYTTSLVFLPQYNFMRIRQSSFIGSSLLCKKDRQEEQRAEPKGKRVRRLSTCSDEERPCISSSFFCRQDLRQDHHFSSFVDIITVVVLLQHTLDEETVVFQCCPCFYTRFLDSSSNLEVSPFALHSSNHSSNIIQNFNIIQKNASPLLYF